MRDNLNISFATLFSVDLHHLYYASTRAETLTAAPTSGCRRVMRNHGMLFRALPGGFTVLQQAADNGAGRMIPVRPLADGRKLTFLLTAKDGDPLSASSLPLDGNRDRIYGFDNLTANPRDGRLLLSADTASPYVTAADRLPIYPTAFKTRITAAAPSVPVTLSDRFGHAIDQRSLDVAAGYADYFIDLSHHGEGRYGLAHSGAPAQSFYAGSEAMVAPRRFGIIEIHQHPQVPAAYRFQDAADNALQPKTYAVVIDSRRTVWRYYFIHKYRLTEMTADQWPNAWPPDWPASLPADWPPAWPTDWPAQWEVVHPSAGGVQIAPRPSAMKKMPDGCMAIPFVSTQPLALTQTPPKGIGLHFTGAGSSDSGITEMDNLPGPTVRTLAGGAEGGDYFSDVFIYL